MVLIISLTRYLFWFNLCFWPTQQQVIASSSLLAQSTVLTSHRQLSPELEAISELLMDLDTLPRNRVEEGFGRGGDLGASKKFRSKSQSNVRTAAKEYEITVELKNSRAIPVPDNYSGFLVEIMSDFEPLPNDHQIFQRHGRILMNRKQSGELAYYIGSFPTSEAAQRFMDKMLLPIYPEALVVNFKEGRRLIP